VGEGPNVTLSGAQTAAASFVAPAVTADTVLTFQLAVTDSTGVTTTASARVTVNAASRPLLLSAGPGQSVVEGAMVTLAGSASVQTAGAIVTYQWKQLAGPSVRLANPGTASASFTAPATAPAPIVDPDLLIAGDFRHSSEAPYTTLYLSRQKQVASWSQKAWGPPLAAFNGMLRTALGGKELSDLKMLAQQSQGGTDIAPQLESMRLSVAAFTYILRLGALVEAGQLLLDSEWSDLDSLLIQVQKLRNVPVWRREEREAQLSLSPTSFNYPSALPSLFATGVDASGEPLGDGATDPHWSIVATPAGSANAPALVTSTGASPIGTTWMRNGSFSRWISPQSDERTGDPVGSYTYRTSTDLSGYDPESIELTARIAVAQSLTGIDLNGRNLALTASGFGGFTALSITGPFLSGTNTLDLVVNTGGSGSSPSGLRVELSFAALPQLDPLSAWRATDQARRTWQSVLRGRVDQVSTLVESRRSSVDVTEERTLPRLRDALVAACSNVEWLSARLLIDFQGNRTQETTRLDQAIESTQALFFALRNHEFALLSPTPDVGAWVLNEGLSQFDDEWDSMGSYANWRALTLAFLYPENLLLPALRLGPPVSAGGEPQAVSERTPAFDDIVARLSNYGGMLTPDFAVREANAYLTNGLNGKTSGGQPSYPHLPDELNLAKSDALYVDPRALDGAHLASLAASKQQALLSHTQSSDWIGAAILWEAWYFVPLQLALELQKAQQFEGALAWFRLVYADDVPLTVTVGGTSDAQRRVFPGLRMEGTQSRYVQPPTWTVTFANPHQIAVTRACPYTRFAYLSVLECLLEYADAQFSTETVESLSNARALYRDVVRLLAELPGALAADWVTASNPRLEAMRRHAANNLAKLHAGRNIAGMAVPAPSATGGPASIQPTAYRYAALVDRARQLVTLAQQIEGSYLATLQKGDDEAYSALRASQDLESANATVKLAQLKLNEANDGVTLAADQQQRAQIQVNHYEGLLSSDIVLLEQLSLGMLVGEISQQVTASAASSAAAGMGGWSVQTLFSSGSNIAQNIAAAASSTAAWMGTTAQLLSATASLEEKQNDWQFQLQLASEDVTIAQQQVQIANDGVSIANQDLNGAVLQVNHAQATADFLTNKKFTNADLYRWMSGVLGSVYAYFLRQATAMARLAETQLAFERQEAVLSVIQPDYWQPLTNGPAIPAGGGPSPDRRGLTAPSV
jgi:hypothetical protein